MISAKPGKYLGNNLGQSILTSPFQAPLKAWVLVPVFVIIAISAGLGAGLFQFGWLNSAITPLLPIIVRVPVAAGRGLFQGHPDTAKHTGVGTRKGCLDRSGVGCVFDRRVKSLSQPLIDFSGLIQPLLLSIAMGNAQAGHFDSPAAIFQFGAMAFIIPGVS